MVIVCLELTVILGAYSALKPEVSLSVTKQPEQPYNTHTLPPTESRCIWTSLPACYLFTQLPLTRRPTSTPLPPLSLKPSFLGLGCGPTGLDPSCLCSLKETEPCDHSDTQRKNFSLPLLLVGVKRCMYKD